MSNPPLQEVVRNCVKCKNVRGMMCVQCWSKLTEISFFVKKKTVFFTISEKPWGMKVVIYDLRNLFIISDFRNYSSKWKLFFFSSIDRGKYLAISRLLDAKFRSFHTEAWQLCSRKKSNQIFLELNSKILRGSSWWCC